MYDKEKILDLYFMKKYKQIEIVNLLNISSSTVNRVIMSDERYLEEKYVRQKENKLKNRKKTMDYINRKRKSKKQDEIYENLRKQHNEASKELSGGRKQISNRAFLEWNRSIYKYNKNSNCYIVKKGITVGADVPKRINWK